MRHLYRFKSALIGLALMAGVATLRAQEAFDSGGVTVIAEEFGLSGRRSWNTLDDNYTSTSYQTMYCNNANTAYVIYFFNERVRLTQIRIWNLNDPDYTTSSPLSGVELFASSDHGATYVAVTNPATQTTVFPMTPGPGDETIQPDVVDLDHEATHLEVRSANSGRRGFSAIQFVGFRPDPEETTAIRRIMDLSVHGSIGEYAGYPASNTIDGTPYSENRNYWWWVEETDGVWITYNLNGPRRLSHVYIWNACDGDINAKRGMKRIRLLGSQDGITYTPFPSLEEEYTLSYNTPWPDRIDFGDLDSSMGSKRVSYIKIESLENFGDTRWTWLSEVIFFEKLSPPTGTVIMVR